MAYTTSAIAAMGARSIRCEGELREGVLANRNDIEQLSLSVHGSQSQSTTRLTPDRFAETVQECASSCCCSRSRWPRPWSACLCCARLKAPKTRILKRVGRFAVAGVPSYSPPREWASSPPSVYFCPNRLRTRVGGFTDLSVTWPSLSRGVMVSWTSEVPTARHLNALICRVGCVFFSDEGFAQDSAIWLSNWQGAGSPHGQLP